MVQVAETAWRPQTTVLFFRSHNLPRRERHPARSYENGALAATERWTAILTIVVETPRDAERLRKNPLGVFVHAINWSKELG